MRRFEKRSFVPAAVEDVFAYYASREGFREQFPFRLDWQSGPLQWRLGDELNFRYRVGWMWLTHRARVVKFERDRCFVDEMTSGFYRRFKHTHDSQRSPSDAFQPSFDSRPIFGLGLPPPSPSRGSAWG
jgi:hypothetical protein